MGNCAGIDWASEEHPVLVEDPAGEELLAATFSHDEDGISGLCAALMRLEVEVVAIERPDGLLVDRLLDAGIGVLALHPNQVKAARARFRASGGKSDRFDRFVLCELARTDRHRFRPLEPDSDETKALRALVRAREDLVGALVALRNQLRSELERFWPGPIGPFNDLDSRISLAFLARYPSPIDARLLGEKRLAAFLNGQRYNNRKTPAQLLGRLRSAPAGRAGELETRRRRSVVKRLVATLQVLIEQIAGLESERLRSRHVKVGKSSPVPVFGPHKHALHAYVVGRTPGPCGLTR
jgi:transposase